MEAKTLTYIYKIQVFFLKTDVNVNKLCLLFGKKIQSFKSLI